MRTDGGEKVFFDPHFLHLLMLANVGLGGKPQPSSSKTPQSVPSSHCE